MLEYKYTEPFCVIGGRSPERLSFHANGLKKREVHGTERLLPDIRSRQ